MTSVDLSKTSEKRNPLASQSDVSTNEAPLFATNAVFDHNAEPRDLYVTDAPAAAPEPRSFAVGSVGDPDYRRRQAMAPSDAAVTGELSLFAGNAAIYSRMQKPKKKSYAWLAAPVVLVGVGALVYATTPAKPTDSYAAAAKSAAAAEAPAPAAEATPAAPAVAAPATPAIIQAQTPAARAQPAARVQPVKADRPTATARATPKQVRTANPVVTPAPAPATAVALAAPPPVTVTAADAGSASANVNATAPAPVAPVVATPAPTPAPAAPMTAPPTVDPTVPQA